MNEIITIAELPYESTEKGKFEKGLLQKDWFEEYPFLFDEHDARLATSWTVRHYFEWKAAIFLYETYGYLSLLEKYQFKYDGWHRKYHLFNSIIGIDTNREFEKQRNDGMEIRERTPFRRTIQCRSGADGEELVELVDSLDFLSTALWIVWTLFDSRDIEDIFSV